MPTRCGTPRTVESRRVIERVNRVISDEEAKNLERVANEIKELVQALRVDIQRAELVRDDLNKVSRSGKLTRVIVVVLSAVVVAVMTLSVVQAMNVRTVRQLVDTQQNYALCPLYQLFLNSDTAAGREAAIRRGDDIAERAKAFAVIRQSYTALNCQAN